MAKIGRNDPCPCGSGKKHKRCCLARASRAERSSGVEYWPAALQERIAKDVRWEKALQVMPTRRILDVVREAGIPIEPDWFRAEVSRTRCVDDLWREWAEKFDVPEEQDDRIWFAVHELGRRLCADIPTVEGLRELIEEGYSRLERDQSEEAVRVWERAWELLREWPDAEVRDPEQISGYVDIQALVGGWCQDYCDELVECFYERERPEDGERVLRYVAEFCRRFPETDPLARENFRRDAAEVMFGLGRFPEGEEEFGRLAVEFARSAWVFIGWADMLWPRTPFRHPQAPVDFARAEQLYRRALALATAEDANEIRLRLHELEEAKRQ